MKFLTVKEAAEKAGMSYWAMRQRLNPAHPDAVPHLAYPNVGDKPTYRIPADKFEDWLKGHER